MRVNSRVQNTWLRLLRADISSPVPRIERIEAGYYAVVREVAKHVSGGLDTWMVEGLEFLDDHGGHSVVIVSRS